MVSFVRCLAYLVLTNIFEAGHTEITTVEEDYVDICDNFNTTKPGSSCVDFVAEFTLRQVDKWNIVAENNRRRNFVAQGRETRGYLGTRPKAANMVELTWDDELEALAELCTYRCHQEHDFAGCRTVANHQGVGEIFSVDEFKGGQPMTVKERVELWYDSVDHLTTANYREFIKNFRTKVEWVVMMWGDADSIGCSRAVYRKKTMIEVWWCFYSHTGDNPSLEVYIEGEPCSQCPANHKPGQRYPFLCDGHPDGDGSMISIYNETAMTHKVCNSTLKYKCKKVAIGRATSWMRAHQSTAALLAVAAGSRVW